jgi:hypothetical protein
MPMDKHLPDFFIFTKDHSKQVSPAVLASAICNEPSGDWKLTISQARKLHYEAGWMIHELAEVLAMILYEAKIDFKDIAKFYEAHSNELDPGSLPESPNNFFHQIALEVERAFIRAIGEDWLKYYNDRKPLENKKGRTAHASKDKML